MKKMIKTALQKPNFGSGMLEPLTEHDEEKKYAQLFAS